MSSDDQDRSAQTRPQIRLRLFDAFAVELDGARVELPPRTQRLTALLGVRGPLSRGVAAGLLWPEVREDRARASLRAALCAAQRLLPDLIVSRPGDLRLGPQVRTDVADFRALLRTSHHGHKISDAVLDLLPGAPLGGCLVPGWTDDWAVAERELLLQLRLHTLDACAAALAAAGDVGTALELAAAAIQADGLRESAHRRLMQIYLDDGNTVAALRQYEVFRTTLWRTLGLRPSPLMQALIESIRRPRPKASVLR